MPRGSRVADFCPKGGHVTRLVCQQPLFKSLYNSHLQSQARGMRLATSEFRCAPSAVRVSGV
jgi:hypothetical protein